MEQHREIWPPRLELRKEELEDLLQIAMHDALEQAEKLSAAEMKSLMGSMMPGIGGLFS